MHRLRRIRLRRRTDATYPPVHINDREANRASRFPTNNITTTKYTLWNFVPKNLLEQFRRITNVYFLIVVIITLIPAISPLNPLTSIAPLVFVLGVTALKEAYEDFLRYKADARVNGRKYTVYPAGGGERRKASRDLQVGDIVELKADETVPADIVPLCSALPSGSCYVETAQLDGETNLKEKLCPKALHDKGKDACVALRGTCSGELPNADLYSFSGSLTPEGEERVGLEKENLLLRGTQIRNTPWVLGLVLYTGVKSKLSLNQKQPPSKFSTVERRLNKCVIGIFCFKMFCLVVVTALTAGFHANDAQDAWYLDFEGESAAFQTVKNFFSYFALLSFMIPMSLMVTLEVVKVFQGSFMEWDRKMAMDPKNVEETGCKAKTSNLNDELALVQYVFSDKTGTLTSNCMVFHQCSVNGVVYTNAGEGQLKEVIAAGGDNAQWVHEFVLNMAVCHDVNNPEMKNGRYDYKAESPDEKALVEGAETNGYVFNHRTQDSVTVGFPDGSNVSYEVLRVIAFTSSRRRMSVLLKLPDGSYRLYSKGADSVMLELLSSSPRNSELTSVTLDHIEEFCKTGLRTLIMGYRDLSESEVAEFLRRYDETTALQGKARKDAVSEVDKALECELEMIGCSAIEDKLQDDVPGTIHNLLKSGIRVWMITGDKMATAENIALSCRLLSKSMNLITVDTPKSRADCLDDLRSKVAKYVEGDQSKRKVMGLIINGSALNYIFELTDEEKRAGKKVTALAEPFLQLALLCHSVVCCRVTPLQKANIVKLVKEHTKCVSLSIGDGANDVSMIQEAHIGVGIFGKEGTQAARSADYAIHEFRHLRRLLTVHGRWSFVRNAQLIQYYIYKNASFFLVQFWFAFYCGFSAQTIYDDWIVTMFNILFTSIPPFFYALFEKDIDDDIIDEYPEVYRNIQSGKQFTYSTLVTWMLLAIWHSLVFFFGPVMMIGNEPFWSDGKTAGLRNFGAVTATIGITTVVLKLAIESNTWNVFVHLGIWGSIASYWLFFMGESFLAAFVPTQYWQFVAVVTNPTFWMLYLFSIVVCLAPDLIFNFMKRQLYPEDWMVLQEAKKGRKISRSELTDMHV